MAPRALLGTVFDSGGALRMAEQRPRVLLVDDDPALRRAYSALLERQGHSVETASDGQEALGKLTGRPFDVILSDVSMPEMDGLEFLRAVRQRDLDIPIVLMTGDPGLDSAMAAVEYGAFRYLVKPVDAGTLHEVLRRAVRLHQLAQLKRQAFEVHGLADRGPGDRAGLEARFGEAMRSMWMAYQPIVAWRDRRLFGYEALLRSGESTLRGPTEILDAAERLGRLPELGRAIRERVAQEVPRAPADAHIFVNLHSADLNDDELYAGDAPLSGIADRVVLEVTERASLDMVRSIDERMAHLRGQRFRVAVDDLGAGYAGLTSFTLLDPTIVKLDMSLVRDVDNHAKKRSIIRAMSDLCHELGIVVVAEGVETTGEREALADLGCDLLQGYLFGRPAPGFSNPVW